VREAKEGEGQGSHDRGDRGAASSIPWPSGARPEGAAQRQRFHKERICGELQCTPYGYIFVACQRKQELLRESCTGHALL
jgi:hypothetical protein